MYLSIGGCKKRIPWWSDTTTALHPKCKPLGHRIHVLHILFCTPKTSIPFPLSAQNSNLSNSTMFVCIGNYIQIFQNLTGQAPPQQQPILNYYIVCNQVCTSEILAPPFPLRRRMRSSSTMIFLPKVSNTCPKVSNTCWNSKARLLLAGRQCCCISQLHCHN